jgi:hypothetical protein
MTHWVIREWMNAVALALSLCMVWRFFWVIVDTPIGRPRRDAAIALFVVFSGESLRAGWAWLALASQNKRWPIAQFVQESWLVGVIAIGTIMVGAICCIRVFSDPDNTTGGLGAIAIAFIFLMISVLS